VQARRCWTRVVGSDLSPVALAVGGCVQHPAEHSRSTRPGVISGRRRTRRRERYIPSQQFHFVTARPRVDSSCIQRRAPAAGLADPSTPWTFSGGCRRRTSSASMEVIPCPQPRSSVSARTSTRSDAPRPRRPSVGVSSARSSKVSIEAMLGVRARHGWAATTPPCATQDLTTPHERPRERTAHYRRLHPYT
jgi:hypothetical protein